MSEEVAPGPREGQRWLDAFPWIEAAAAGMADVDVVEPPWWWQAVDEPGSTARRERLAQLSDLCMGRLSRWTIGQIFPGLASDLVLAELHLTVRARNALGRADCFLASDVQNRELADLLGWRHVGVGTVDSILQALADSATGPETLDLPTAGRDVGRTAPAAHATVEGQSALDSQIAEDLGLIAHWHVAVGSLGSPLLGSHPRPGTPTEVLKARQRLESLKACDVLQPHEMELDAAELLQRSIGGLDTRAQEILARRFFADRPETLDVLGRSMGVTRERVRQIEARARASMVDFLERGGSLADIAAAARELVVSVLPLADLLALIPALARSVESVGQPAWRVLDRLDDGYEIEDGWCASPTMLGAQSATQARLEELADSYGVVRFEDIESLNPYQGFDEGRRCLRVWLLYCGYVLDGDAVLTRTQSVGDRAASVLSIVGSPMSPQEILDRLAIERSLGSLKNAMSVDDRFERVDRDSWALAEWGLESYAGVRTLVREEVARGGGQITLDTLVSRLTGKYSVTASSVVAYASAPPFEARGGVVRLASADREIRKSPQRTRRLYRRGNVWLYRVKITKDHLRGSGSVAPMAIAGILDLQYGQTRLLDSTLGPQSVNWTGNQPAFGTIRRFLISDDVAIDDEIFLVIGDDGTFATEAVAIMTGEPLADALALVGETHRSELSGARVNLASAIGLPEGSPAASIIGGYRERGDSDVAELLVSAKQQLEGTVVERPVPSAEIDEILDLL